MTDEQVTDEQVTDEQVTDEQVTDEQVMGEQVMGEQVMGEQVMDEQVIGRTGAKCESKSECGLVYPPAAEKASQENFICIPSDTKSWHGLCIGEFLNSSATAR